MSLGSPKIVGLTGPRLWMPFWEVDLSSRFGFNISGPRWNSQILAPHGVRLPF